MNKLIEYLFCPIEERGRILSFSRFDILLGINLAISLMVALSYLVEGLHALTRNRIILLCILIVGSFLLTKNKVLIFSGAFFVITVRLWIGLLLYNNDILMWMAVLSCSVITYFLIIRMK